MKRIILDANLMVLFIVGSTDPNLIGKHKRTKAFEKEDWDLLRRIVSNFDQILLTPHILTETSNLISQIGEPATSSVRMTFSRLLTLMKEEFEPSVEIVKHQAFIRLGLTDCAILNLMRNRVHLLTADLALFLDAAKENSNAMNFNHVRQQRLMNS